MMTAQNSLSNLLAISSCKRLTLVLHKGAENVQTLWVNSGLDNLEDAIHNLKERERTSTNKIG